MSDDNKTKGDYKMTKKQVTIKLYDTHDKPVWVSGTLISYKPGSGLAMVMDNCTGVIYNNFPIFNVQGYQNG